MVSVNGTIWVQILNFFILVLILAKFAYKPLLQVMKERREKIATDLANAELARETAEKVRVEYEAQLLEARMQAQEIMDRATKLAEEHTQQQLKELQAQLDHEKEQARLEIAREREKAMRQMREEVVTLSLAMAGKVIAKDMQSKENVDLINDAIEQLDSKAVGL